MFRDNVIQQIQKGTLSANDWVAFFAGLSSRVHAEITKGAELWTEIASEVSSEPIGTCENGHPMEESHRGCDICGAPAINLSPVTILLDKKIDVLELSDAIIERLKTNNFVTVRQLFEATDEEIDNVEYIGDVRISLIRSAVSAAVDEFVAG
jgi:DNA-directed RNA polymerase alpha subunit